MHKLSIIIVTWNNENIIEMCLDPLDLNNESTEVIVVDNNSSDRTVEIIETRYTSVKLIKNDSNLGYAKANNQAIEISSSDYILLLNSDAFVLKGSIESLIDFMNINKSVGIAGPQLINPDGTWQRSYGRFPTISFQLCNLLQIQRVDRLINKWKWNHSQKDYPVDYIEGACMLIRRDVIKEIGLLDEDYFFYGEDADFCYRAKKAGWEVSFVIESRVVHLRGASSTKKDKYKYMVPLMESQYYFIKKNFNIFYITTWKILVRLIITLRIIVNTVKCFFFILRKKYQRKEEIDQKINFLKKILKTVIK